MGDPVLPADPIEQRLGVPGAESCGEHLAVVSQYLLRNPVVTQRLGERGADPAGGGPWHEPCDDAEPGVIVDPGGDLELGAVGKEHPSHHVELPKLHRGGTLPASVVGLAPAAPSGCDEAGP